MTLHKFDELDSLLYGLQYVEMNNSTECYYWAHPRAHPICDDTSEKRVYDFSNPYPFLVSKAV
jgi:hypothetical protein